MLTENTILIGFYDYRLVVLSVVIAALASYAALDLAGRVTVARGWARFGWLAGGASAMGLGIWSMHYIGMLAFRLSIPVWYDWPIVLLSLLTAIFAAGAALHFASGRELSLWRTAFGSLVMGAGIGAMHYVGMDAMRMGAMCHFNPSIVALSVILAVGISFVALRLVFLARTHSQRWKFANAIVMGAAIPIMHYTGMAAVSFTVSDEAADLSHAVDVSTLGVIGIATVTILILGIAILTTGYSRLLREPRTMRRGVASARIRALRTAMATVCFLLVFEAAKQALYPKITIWTSHALTISFTAGLAGVLSFIILRKEERLRFELTSSETQYRLLFDCNPLPTWLFARKTLKFLAVNEAAVRHYGFSRQEFLAMTIADIRPKEDVPALLRATDKRIYGLQEAETWRHRKKDGTIIDVEIVSHEMDFQGTDASLVTSHDVSERKKADEIVQRLASIVEFSEDAIIGKNLDGVITSWNRAAQKMYGYTSTEAIGRNLSFLLPSEKQADIRVIMERIRSGQSIECLETERLTKNGSTLDVSLSISPLKDATGRVVGASAIARDITLRKRSEKKLKLQSAALEAAANAIVITDFRGTIQWVNPAFTTMTGYSAEEVLAKNPRLLKSGKQSQSFYADLWSTVSSGKVWHGELINRRKDGTTYIEEQTITPLAQNVGEANWTHFVAIKQDVTERKRAEKELRLTQFSVEHASDDIFWSNSQGHIVYVNKAACDSLGYSREELLSLSVQDLNPHFRKEEDWSMFWKELKRRGSMTFEGQNTSKQGRVFPVEVTANYLEFDGQEYSFAFVRDITARKLTENRVQYLAFYDDLTGLPNRTLLQDRMTKALADARRQKYKVALLFLDLDKFKDINDSLGHAVGDLLLQEVAERLKKCGREQDTAARLGGDEFLIMLTHIKDVSDAAVASERLMDAMTAEFVIQGHSLNVSCSIGISIFPEHGADCETLIKNSDAAMYSAKADGRNNFRFFTDDMNAQAVERLTLGSSLRSALAKKQLFLMYQPQMDIATGRITGLEALLRWQHPELGLVPPDKFIRIAENSGLIVPIGEWVLRTACSQARTWQDEGLPVLTVAVNVSAVQFRQENFGEVIRKVLHETRLPPHYLELELTESLLLTNADLMLTVIQELKAIGVTLAIDDFGTGYSSFSYLKQFQVSKLKIDRSFIRDVAVKPDDAAITTAIISMAKSLNLKVIAEGVENEAQMSFLRAHQCDEIQGYYFSKPLAVDKVADKLRSHGPEPQARAKATGAQS